MSCRVKINSKNSLRSQCAADTHTYTNAWTHEHTWTHKQTRTQTHINNTQTHMSTQTYTNTRTYTMYSTQCYGWAQWNVICTCMHAHTRTCILTSLPMCTYKHTKHTHTHRCAASMQICLLHDMSYFESMMVCRYYMLDALCLSILSAPVSAEVRAVNRILGYRDDVCKRVGEWSCV